MALDSHGNWTPVLPDQPPASGCVYGELSACFGVPDDASGFDGDARINLTTGEFYVKANGAWVLQTGGSGSSGLVQLGVVDPEGVVAEPEGTAYLNTVLKTFWVKQSGGSTATGWEPQLI